MKAAEPRFIACRAALGDADIAVFGIPFEGTVNLRRGADRGPTDLRLASDSIETYSPALDRDLEDLAIADLGDCELGAGSPREQLARARDEVAAFWRPGLRPLMLAHLFVYAVARKWAPRKTYGSDVALWRRAVRLAAVLRRRGITHLHAPWATPNEITALLAARLAGIPYSVQARASDIHRTFTQTGLDQRLGHAEFIVTNAHYNVPVIRSKLPPGVVAMA